MNSMVLQGFASVQSCRSRASAARPRWAAASRGREGHVRRGAAGRDGRSVEPALIERTRTGAPTTRASTGSSAWYPALHCHFLAGRLSTVSEGIELTTGFTAQVNADLTIGAVEETLTVSASAPLVDTQNVMSQSVFSDRVLDQLPVSKTIRSYAPLIVGASMAATSQDVGGNRGEANTSISIHGSRGADMLYTVNGLRPASMMNAGGGSRTYSINAATAQEITFQTGGISAESETGGIQMNVVPTEGGERADGFERQFANARCRGEYRRPICHAWLLPPLKLRKIYDVNQRWRSDIRDRIVLTRTATWDSHRRVHTANTSTRRRTAVSTRIRSTRLPAESRRSNSLDWRGHAETAGDSAAICSATQLSADCVGGA